MNILDKIVEQKRRELERLPAGSVTVDSLRTAIADRGGCRDFLGALRNPKRGGIAVESVGKIAANSSREMFCPVMNLTMANGNSSATILNIKRTTL